MRMAKRVVFDIDYRPVLWGLTSPGRGEDRFVKSEFVTKALQDVIPRAHLVIGTEEEFHIAGGHEDTARALERLQGLAPEATFVVKRGPLGCSVHSRKSSFEHRGFPVEVFNVLGAGDGFAAGFLSGWLKELPLEECARRANACGALVVSRHGCAPAMASREELELFLSRRDWPARLRDSAELEYVHRRTTGRRERAEVLALAFDHRRQLEELAPPERIRRFKGLIARALLRASVPGMGAIVDERHGEEALFALTGTALWLARPVEAPGSAPLEFEAGDNVGVALRSWPKEHVVKCLSLSPSEDLPRLKLLHDACVATGHELLIELVSRQPPLEAIYAAGIKPDWWKLVCPVNETEWEKLENIISRHDPHCRGVLLLGMEASEDELERGFALAARHPVCKGFAVGRSIFMDSARRWFAGQCSDETAVQEIAARYASLAAKWAKARSECKESVS
jgi:5-dehydro-2-deoxygluconokinase